MIDTHAHLLPGVDDGASTLGESLAMAREASLRGVREVVCTPHLRYLAEPTPARATQALVDLDIALHDHGIRLKLHLGYEMTFSFVMEAGPEGLGGFTLGRGCSSVLLEVPHSGWPPFAPQIVEQVCAVGLRPVLAHPERNPRMQGDPLALPSLLEAGAVAQGTMASHLGFFGKSAKRTLVRMLQAGEIDLLATDAHFHRHGTWSFFRGQASLGTVVDGETWRLLTEENPRALLRDDPLRSPAPSVSRRGGAGSLRRLFG